MNRVFLSIILLLAGCSPSGANDPAFQYIQGDSSNRFPVIFDRKTGCIADVKPAFHHEASGRYAIAKNVLSMRDQGASKQEVDAYLAASDATADVLKLLANNLASKSTTAQDEQAAKFHPNSEWTSKTVIGDWVCPKPIRARSEDIAK